MLGGRIAGLAKPRGGPELGGLNFVDLQSMIHQLGFQTNASGIGSVSVNLPYTAALVGE
jgi:hypothetical protein